MKHIAWNGPGDLQVREKPTPVATAGFSLVRVRFAGLCATDREISTGAMAQANLGVTPGHEIAGVVVDSIAPNAWEPGARVVVDSVYECGVCASCLRQRPAECEDPQELGYTADGGWAEYVLVHNARLYRIPDFLDDIDAVLCEPFAMPFGSMMSSGEPIAGCSVFIVGSGVSAFAFASVAVSMNARSVRISLKSDVRRPLFESIDPRVSAFATSSDAGTHDVAIDTIGSSQSIRAAIAAVRDGGRVLCYGLSEANVDFPLRDVVLRNLRVSGHVNPPAVWPAFMKAIAEQKIRLDGLVDRRISIDEVPAAVLEWGSNLRTVIQFDSDEAL